MEPVAVETIDVEKDHPSVAVLGREMGGFSLELHRRNAMLFGAGSRAPGMKKTGTTIVGVVYKDGIVLGADTRATEGTVIADKKCEKIHYLADNILCCGAGTAADTENVTLMIRGQLELLKLATGTNARVVAAMTLLKRRLFQYQGHVSAALVLGGVDVTGPHLYTIYPHGSTDKLPFVTMGSGSLAAMSVFESRYRDEMDEEEASALVTDAISAGIWNDLGSGGNVDLCIIRKDQTHTMIYGHKQENDGAELRKKHTRPTDRLRIPLGATAILGEPEFKAHKSTKVAGGSGAGTGAGMDTDE